MLQPILATKLYIPHLRQKFVLRPRLIERLNGGLHGKLTLLSAPAGFGKSTLLSEWVQQVRRLEPGVRAAWLSLDQGDSDLNQFLAYLIAAAQTVAADAGRKAMDALQSPQPPPPETLLTELLNDIATIPETTIFVLEDYHALDSQAVDQALAFMLAHLPHNMLLVISTRADPALSLASLRVRGQLTELRADDLRFSLTDTAAFLNDVMELNLPENEIATLETRTEGWIAGLQLAALSIRGRTDVNEFIRAFAGDDRYIVDYLVEEVLERQPEGLRRFLLQTAILDRLSGPLCDAVTRQRNSRRLLETLERGNLFLVPLDDKRYWYRYHHLFADVLQVHAQEELAEQLPALHLRASVWYEQNDDLTGAIRHALAAEDFERAAMLVERVSQQMNRSFRSAALLRWLKALPDEVVRMRPVLSAEYAWALLSTGALDAAGARLEDAERWLESTSDGGGQSDADSTGTGPGRARGPVIVDEDQFRSLPGMIALGRAYLAGSRKDVPGAILQASRALDFLPEGDHFQRGVAATLLGLAHWTNGDLEIAHRTFAGGVAEMRRAGDIQAAVSGTFTLAGIRLAQGKLRDAIAIYEEAIRFVSERDGPSSRGTADLHAGLSELQLEQGDLEAAANHLRISRELGKRAALPERQYRSSAVPRARLKLVQGQPDAALALLEGADRLNVPGPVPDVRPVAAFKARIWIAQGRLAEAQAWVRERELSVEDDLSYLHEYEHITLARALLASYRLDGKGDSLLEAIELLERLAQAAEKGERMGSLIEILVLQALAVHARGEFPSALELVKRALALAGPEGYVRVFIDEGEPVARLLTEASGRGIHPDFSRKLVSAWEAEQQRRANKSGRPSAQPLLEPLSRRELEVLELIAEGLSNREIGKQLFLALSTVKGHNQKIFGKLQVRRRTEAVARARELDLL